MIAYETIVTSGAAVSGPLAVSARRVRIVWKMCASFDPVLQRPVVARRDHGAVGDRVGVGDSDLDHVRTALDQLGDQGRGGRQVGVARRDERHQGAAAFAS